jgi:hypothetical protein
MMTVDGEIKGKEKWPQRKLPPSRARLSVRPLVSLSLLLTREIPSSIYAGSFFCTKRRRKR